MNNNLGKRTHILFDLHRLPSIKTVFFLVNFATSRLILGSNYFQLVVQIILFMCNGCDPFPTNPNPNFNPNQHPVRIHSYTDNLSPDYFRGFL